MTPSGGSGRWWVCSDLLDRGGRKIIGPFESQDLAWRVRGFIEKAERRDDLWLDEDRSESPFVRVLPTETVLSQITQYPKVHPVNQR